MRRVPSTTLVRAKRTPIVKVPAAPAYSARGRASRASAGPPARTGVGNQVRSTTVRLGIRALTKSVSMDRALRLEPRGAAATVMITFVSSAPRASTRFTACRPAPPSVMVQTHRSARMVRLACSATRAHHRMQPSVRSTSRRIACLAPSVLAATHASSHDRTHRAPRAGRTQKSLFH